MSEDEKFLSRWSRKKRAAVDLPPQAADSAAADAASKQAVAVPGDATKGEKPEAAEPTFDLASLPSIDSIGPDTDIRMFLRAGVPAELTRTALRRAWMADPAIRDFIGLAENSWDFTKQGGVPGFDLSDPGIDVKQLATELFGRLPESGKSAETPALSTEVARVAPVDAAMQPVAAAKPPDHDMLRSEPEIAAESPDRLPEQRLLATQKDSDAAMQHPREQEVDPLPVRKRHGGALPS